MSTEPFIGEVKIFAFNFAPRGYMFCQNQILAISSNTALFSLLGTTYGGNGQTTFALPDLRGRMVIGQGTGPGLPSHSMGEMAGTPTVTILSSNMPAHVHAAAGITVQIPVSSESVDSASPNGAFLTTTPGDTYASVPTAGQSYGATQVSGTTGVAGGSQPIGIMNPYLVLNYSIATVGIFPSRN